MRYLLIAMLTLLTFSWGNAEKRDPVELSKLPNGHTLMRIHLNYLNPQHKVDRVRSTDGIRKFDIPIPEKWQVVQARGHIRYTSSILLIDDLSAGVIAFNDIVLKQFKLDRYTGKGAYFTIPKELFRSYNQLTFESIMHYTKTCEDPSHSTLWSDINLAESYIELEVVPKPLPELVSSLETHIFDKKQYLPTPFHFVRLSPVDDTALHRYAFFSAVTANHLKYRLVRFSVSQELDPDAHNILIGSKEAVRTFLTKKIGAHYLSEPDPVLTLLFNQKDCAALTYRQSDFNLIPSRKGVTTTTKDAFMGRSLELERGKLLLARTDDAQSRSKTVSFWFRMQPDRPRAVLFSFKTYALVYLDGKLGFNTLNRDLFGASAEKLADGEWHHIVAVFHEGSIQKNRIYLDGRPLKLRQISGMPNPKNALFSDMMGLGGMVGTNRFNISGLFDQFYLYDSALNDSVITRMTRLALTRKKEGLSEDLYFQHMLDHDINIIRNPANIANAVIAIAPESADRIDTVLRALSKDDLFTYTRHGMDVGDVKIPEPAPAYSSNKFIPTGQKIYFKDLGFKTKLLKGQYPEKVRVLFNLYPDDYLDAKDTIETRLHTVLPTVVRYDSVINIYLNDKFAKQIDIYKEGHPSKVSIAANLLMSLESNGRLPSYLVVKGHNEMRFDFSLVPLKKGACEIYNRENLVATLMDDSYFKLPKAKKWIEMPYLEYIRDAAYPFSIYPDFQDTVFYLADRDDRTIATALDYLFYLSQSIQSYPYYLDITFDLNEKNRQKNIVVFGTVDNPAVQKLSRSMPVTLDGDLMEKIYPQILKFLKKRDILDTEERAKYRFETVMHEKNFIDGTLINQIARSPFDGDKILQMITATSHSCLEEGLVSLYRYQNRHHIGGDLLLYNPAEETGIAYNIKDKYILTKMNFLDALALKVSADPVRYIIFMLLALFVLSYIVRVLLRRYKGRHFADADIDNVKSGKKK